MTYDLGQKVLFSGMLFSSEYDGSKEQPVNIFARESDWEAMRRFHIKQMPSQKAMVIALKKLKILSPKPDFIAPRYGKIISGDLFEFFLDRLIMLQVGADRMMTPKDGREQKIYIEAMNTLLGRIQSYMPLDESRVKLNNNVKIAAACGFENSLVTEITGNPEKMFMEFIKALMQDEQEKTASQVKTAALKIAYSLGINLPDF
jgi:hypothetical protein